MTAHTSQIVIATNQSVVEKDTKMETVNKKLITVIPASTKVGQATIQALLADPWSPRVRGVYRDTAKAH